MAFRMRSLLKLNRKKKAQFFVLSAFTIVSILYIISSWIQPFSIIDTSSIVLMEEPFIFNNLKEKAIQTVNVSRNCDDLKFNLDEYNAFVQQYATSKNLNLIFNYQITPCQNNFHFPVLVAFKMQIKSTNVQIQSNFTENWNRG